MRRSICFASCFVVLGTICELAWSQSAGGSANPDNSPGNPVSDAKSTLGGANPSASGSPLNPNLDTTDVSPLDRPDRETGAPLDEFNQQQPRETRQPLDANQSVVGSDWRMVPHNGVWWYWTPNNSWLYYRNNQWNAYIPGSVRRQQAMESRMGMQQRQRVGYRGDVAYEAEMNGQAYQNHWQGQYQGQGGVRAGTNYGGTQFYVQRPMAPNAVQLQGFQQPQPSTATHVGGTSTSVQDPNLGTSNPVAGSNPIRGGVPTPGNPGMPGPSGNAGAPNPAGGTTTPGPATPSDPARGAGPATGTSGTSTGTSGTGTATGTGTGS